MSGPVWGAESPGRGRPSDSQPSRPERSGGRTIVDSGRPSDAESAAWLCLERSFQLLEELREEMAWARALLVEAAKAETSSGA